MTDISQIANNTQALTMQESTGGETLGKQDFLKLLITQLQNQDPLNPSDPTKFSSQLAEFSSLEQMSNINQNVKNLSGTTEAINKLTSLSMLGKQVVLQKDTFSLADEPVKLGYQLEKPATQVNLKIKDADGATVAQVEGDKVTAGNHFVSWDGQGLNGQDLPPGKYSFSVEVIRNGEHSKGKSLVRSEVTGLENQGSINRLLTELGPVGIQDILEVQEAETSES